MSGIYRHHGGGVYAVLAQVRDSTNGPGEGRQMVVYYSLARKLVYVRESGQFHERVQWPDGTLRPRFEELTVEVRR